MTRPGVTRRPSDAVSCAALAEKKLTTPGSLRLAFSSWRLGSVSLLSFSSGLPLGLIVTAIPFWMQQEGIDVS